MLLFTLPHEFNLNQIYFDLTYLILRGNSFSYYYTALYFERSTCKHVKCEIL